ncbi:RNA polymerase sigma factor SigJ [Pseudonocardia endophytica]|uniref:RNA polymerase sigma-70 factor (ECF subfamily) n=1 Tax=Pseudonocardia endophytica TaxID=401976 RepID=A0A4R1HJT1_PSEEN|nr:RNA polymerase sigma factor SigJ [Pseudonocardia endophytica]TCK21251.1 RNA polymerase sigma-70 factor (ECF subfamily) [Pseudonocardia endophytica]
MTTGTDQLAARFEESRAHLLGVGYRITGSLADAEDAVQEAWLRLARSDDPESVRDLRAWSTTTVARLCLDRLRSAAARRERHVGPWLPEPLVTTPDDTGPLAELVRAEDVRMAAMVVLERLGPAQRVAFVLHEALDLPYDEIGAVLGCSADAARQHAARARRAIADEPAPPRAPDIVAAAALQRFAEALAGGDASALTAVLHPDVVMVNDGGGRVSAARRPIAGPDKVSRLLFGLLGQYGPGLMDGRPVLVNGEPGFLVPGDGDVSTSVTVLTLQDGLIRSIHSVLDPEKLTRLPAGE